MLIALRRVVGVPYDYVTALLVRHDIWGFLFWFWFFVFVFGRSERVTPPHPVAI